MTLDGLCLYTVVRSFLLFKLRLTALEMEGKVNGKHCQVFNFHHIEMRALGTAHCHINYPPRMVTPFKRF